MIKAQAFIGIDPSLTHTGLIILSPAGDILCKEVIITKPVKGWRAQVARQKKVVEAIKTIIDDTMKRYGVAVIMVEDYAVSRWAKTAIPTIELGGLLRAMLALLPDTVEFVSPATLKKFVTGKGNADKIAVSVAIAKRFNVDFGSDDNLYDAMGLAHLAMAVSGYANNLNKGQLEIADKLRGNGIHAKL